MKSKQCFKDKSISRALSKVDKFYLKWSTHSQWDWSYCVKLLLAKVGGRKGDEDGKKKTGKKKENWLGV